MLIKLYICQFSSDQFYIEMFISYLSNFKRIIVRNSERKLPNTSFR